MAYRAGEYERAVVRALERGQLGLATRYLPDLAKCQSALGNLAASREALARNTELAERIGNPPFITLQLVSAALDYTEIQGKGYGAMVPVLERMLTDDAPETPFLMAVVGAAAALVYAHEGRGKDALRALERVLPAIERAAGWASNYTAMVYYLIEALWVLERVDHVEVLERNLREKTLAPDFRTPHADARLALARLCALTGRVDEARKWFDKARRVLDEQGARPLRAIADFDEAWMEVRRGRAGDCKRALALLTPRADLLSRSECRGGYAEPTSWAAAQAIALRDIRSQRDK